MIDLIPLFAPFECSTAAPTVLAYLDPGTGSYALQVLLATLFGGMYAARQSWSGIKVRLASALGDRRGRATLENARPGIHGQSTAEIR